VRLTAPAGNRTTFPNEEEHVFDDDDGGKVDHDAQSPEAGAAQDEQGLGQHDDKDATDVDTKQDHPATPSDMGSR
jgi:hypothetical protein